MNQLAHPHLTHSMRFQLESLAERLGLTELEVVSRAVEAFYNAKESDMKKEYSISATENGYIILQPGTDFKQWVARSWAEVLEILTEIGAPDFVETVKQKADR